MSHVCSNTQSFYGFAQSCSFIWADFTLLRFHCALPILSLPLHFRSLFLHFSWFYFFRFSFSVDESRLFYLRLQKPKCSTSKQTIALRQFCILLSSTIQALQTSLIIRSLITLCDLVLISDFYSMMDSPNLVLMPLHDSRF